MRGLVGVEAAGRCCQADVGEKTRPEETVLTCAQDKLNFWSGLKE